MGDRRYAAPLERVQQAADRKTAIEALPFDQLVQALGAASRAGDPLLANVLTTAVLNRSRRMGAVVLSLGVALASALLLTIVGAVALWRVPHNVEDEVFLAVTLVALAVGAAGGWLAHGPIRARILAHGRA